MMRKVRLETSGHLVVEGLIIAPREWPKVVMWGQRFFVPDGDLDAAEHEATFQETMISVLVTDLNGEPMWKRG